MVGRDGKRLPWLSVFYTVLVLALLAVEDTEEGKISLLLYK